MTPHLLDEARKIIPKQPVLVNVVSRRVRQLSAGHSPLVEVLPRMDYSDIALKEIIERKITFDQPEQEQEES